RLKRMGGSPRASAVRRFAADAPVAHFAGPLTMVNPIVKIRPDPRRGDQIAVHIGTAGVGLGSFAYSARPEKGSSLPGPTQDRTYILCPCSVPPSNSPISSVLLVPSEMPATDVAERLLKTPSYLDQYWLLPWPARQLTPQRPIDFGAACGTM